MERNGTLSSERRARTMQPTACGRFERGGGAPTVGAPTVGARRAGWARIAGCRGHPGLGTDVGGDGMAKAPASRVRDVKGGWGVGGAEEGAKGRPYKICVIREASLESRMGCAAYSSSPRCQKPSTIYASFRPCIPSRSSISPARAVRSLRPPPRHEVETSRRRAGWARAEPKTGALWKAPDERGGSHRRGPVQEVDHVGVGEGQRRSRRGRTLESVGAEKERVP
ncbi:hypothetical protein C8J57DRAFT_1304505, partial [Mycena rebaudengoi]